MGNYSLTTSNPETRTGCLKFKGKLKIQPGAWVPRTSMSGLEIKCMHSVNSQDVKQKFLSKKISDIKIKLKTRQTIVLTAVNV